VVLKAAKDRAKENLKGMPAEPISERHKQLLDEQKKSLAVLLDKHNPNK
jgi:hypothetical protein